MSIIKVGNWNQARAALTGSVRKLQRATDRAVLQEAHFFRKKIVQGITKQAPGGKRFKKLARTTIRSRRFKGFGGRKVLIRTAELRNSVTVVRRTGGVFVGVLKTARGKDGRSLVDVALVHEKGSRPIVIRITPKMRRFLAAMFKGRLKKTAAGFSGIIVVQIPKRPFLAPVFKKWGKTSVVKKRFLARVAKNLKGQYGSGVGLAPS